jgi:hypothetical protein
MSCALDIPLEPTVLIEINVRASVAVVVMVLRPSRQYGKTVPSVRLPVRGKSSCPTSFKYLARCNMPLYMFQGTYTPQSWAAQVKNPQNRIETVGREACEAVGGKLVGAWYCFGDR